MALWTCRAGGQSVCSHLVTALLVQMQWGSPEYHVQSLKNLAEAMQHTKMLCATIVDTVGAHIRYPINMPAAQCLWTATGVSHIWGVTH